MLPLTRMCLIQFLKAYKAWKKCITNGEPLDLATANEIAQAMKQWAVEKGATHYTHWFQPMTGVTAEKHDSFISPAGGGKIVMDFSGKELVRGARATPCHDPPAFPSSRRCSAAGSSWTRIPP